MNKKYGVIGVAILVVLIVGGYFIFFWRNSATTPNDTVSNTITQADLMGKTFRLVSVSGKNVSARYTMKFGNEKIDAYICNSISGEYSITYDTLYQKGSWIATKRRCIGEQGDIEKQFNDLIHASPHILVSGTELTLSANGQTFVFVQE